MFFPFLQRPERTPHTFLDGRKKPSDLSPVLVPTFLPPSLLILIDAEYICRCPPPCVPISISHAGRTITLYYCYSSSSTTSRPPLQCLHSAVCVGLWQCRYRVTPFDPRRAFPKRLPPSSTFPLYFALPMAME